MIQCDTLKVEDKSEPGASGRLTVVEAIMAGLDRGHLGAAGKGEASCHIVHSHRLDTLLADSQLEQMRLGGQGGNEPCLWRCGCQRHYGARIEVVEMIVGADHVVGVEHFLGHNRWREAPEQL